MRSAYGPRRSITSISVPRPATATSPPRTFPRRARTRCSRRCFASAAPRRRSTAWPKTVRTGPRRHRRTSCWRRSADRRTAWSSASSSWVAQPPPIRRRRPTSSRRSASISPACCRNRHRPISCSAPRRTNGGASHRSCMTAWPRSLPVSSSRSRAASARSIEIRAPSDRSSRRPRGTRGQRCPTCGSTWRRCGRPKKRAA